MDTKCNYSIMETQAQNQQGFGSRASAPMLLPFPSSVSGVQQRSPFLCPSTSPPGVLQALYGILGGMNPNVVMLALHNSSKVNPPMPHNVFFPNFSYNQHPPATQRTHVVDDLEDAPLDLSLSGSSSAFRRHSSTPDSGIHATSSSSSNMSPLSLKSFMKPEPSPALKVSHLGASNPNLWKRLKASLNTSRRGKATHDRIQKPYYRGSRGDMAATRSPGAGSGSGCCSTKAQICNQCNEPFFSTKALDDHTQRVHGTYRCTFSGCHVTFTQRSNLNRHCLGHMDNKPISCTLCGKRFKRKDHCVKHVQEAHGVSENCREFVDADIATSKCLEALGLIDVASSGSMRNNEHRSNSGRSTDNTEVPTFSLTSVVAPCVSNCTQSILSPRLDDCEVVLPEDSYIDVVD